MDLLGLRATRLAGWLRTIGLPGELTDATPLSGGTQNIMLRLTVGDRTVVLRHPPLHRRPHSNRSLGREMRVLRALTDTGVPHTRLLGGSLEDPALDGATAFVTAFVPGFNPGDAPGPDAYADPAWRRAAALDVVSAFARLGSLDHTALGLADLGRPAGFLGRQIELTKTTWEAVSSVADTPVDVAGLIGWLGENAPRHSQVGLTHGDAHLNNVILREEAPAVAALVDFEMVTVGDPLLDLGWLIACWPRAGAPEAAISGSSLAQRGALPGPESLAEHYATHSSLEVARLDWYACLAATKLATLLETTHLRALRGEASNDTGRRLHRFATDLFAFAEDIRRGRSVLT